MQLKVTAVTKRGAPIITVLVHEDETLGDILNIISDQLAQNPSRRAFLNKWIEGERMLRIAHST